MGGSGERRNKNELSVLVRMLSLQAWKIQYKHLFTSQASWLEAVQILSGNSARPPKCQTFSSSLTHKPHRASVLQQLPIHLELGEGGAAESRRGVQLHRAGQWGGGTFSQRQSFLGDRTVSPDHPASCKRESLAFVACAGRGIRRVGGGCGVSDSQFC